MSQEPGITDQLAEDSHDLLERAEQEQNQVSFQFHRNISSLFFIYFHVLNDNIRCTKKKRIMILLISGLSTKKLKFPRRAQPKLMLLNREENHG